MSSKRKVRYQELTEDGTNSTILSLMGTNNKIVINTVNIQYDYIKSEPLNSLMDLI